jgi:hypothetical protein
MDDQRVRVVHNFSLVPQTTSRILTLHGISWRLKAGTQVVADAAPAGGRSGSEITHGSSHRSRLKKGNGLGRLSVPRRILFQQPGSTAAATATANAAFADYADYADLSQAGTPASRNEPGFFA